MLNRQGDLCTCNATTDNDGISVRTGHKVFAKRRPTCGESVQRFQRGPMRFEAFDSINFTMDADIKRHNVESYWWAACNGDLTPL